mmetsp:Transcript_26392/g.55615  ORF Transcript_26392/g.55615 Transcript_26392/m.55615 type:complete len:268 (-) Transcript_26392:99-902(-)
MFYPVGFFEAKKYQRDLSFRQITTDVAQNGIKRIPAAHDSLIYSAKCNVIALYRIYKSSAHLKKLSPVQNHQGHTFFINVNPCEWYFPYQCGANIHIICCFVCSSSQDRIRIHHRVRFAPNHMLANFCRGKIFHQVRSTGQTVTSASELHVLLSNIPSWMGSFGWNPQTFPISNIGRNRVQRSRNGQYGSDRFTFSAVAERFACIWMVIINTAKFHQPAHEPSSAFPNVSTSIDVCFSHLLQPMCVFDFCYLTNYPHCELVCWGVFL